MVFWVEIVLSKPLSPIFGSACLCVCSCSAPNLNQHTYSRTVAGQPIFRAFAVIHCLGGQRQSGDITDAGQKLDQLCQMCYSFRLATTARWQLPGALTTHTHTHSVLMLCWLSVFFGDATNRWKRKWNPFAADKADPNQSDKAVKDGDGARTSRGHCCCSCCCSRLNSRSSSRQADNRSVCS